MGGKVAKLWGVPHQLNVSYMRREVDGRGISGTRFVANPS